MNKQESKKHAILARDVPTVWQAMPTPRTGFVPSRMPTKWKFKYEELSPEEKALWDALAKRKVEL